MTEEQKKNIIDLRKRFFVQKIIINQQKTTKKYRLIYYNLSVVYYINY